ncbi:Oxidoreductase, short-chain dehydrogenase/reductase family [Olavius algarvensis Delta 1 endosymbiont]|nr:Oxidoreductase, short-chain dehydrogenase/reductase family [Olavius algarvensis Delta 1 endosymbiont]
MKLSGKVAIVTGSSQGIGCGIALKFAESGADVVINYHTNDDAAKTVAEQVRSLGRKALTIRADVSKAADVEHMVNKTLEAFGAIDILVNNAGIFIGGTIAELEEDTWDRVMAVNLKGVFLCCRAVGNYMMANQVKGSIINIASISGRLPELNGNAYSPSKAGVISLSALLAVEWAGYGIRVNSLSPGPVMTPLQQSIYATPALLAARNRGIPMNRHGRPEEIGSAAVFLASDDASYVTGENLSVDGGSLASMYHLIHQISGQH